MQHPFFHLHLDFVISTEEASIFGEEDIYLLLLLNIKNENLIIGAGRIADYLIRENLNGISLQ